MWADVGSEVERAREAVDELRALVRRIRQHAATAGDEDAGAEGGWGSGPAGGRRG